MFGLLILLCAADAFGTYKRYKAYNTPTAYVFNVLGSGYRASISDDNVLMIRSPRFQRKWNLPLDSDKNKARFFNSNGMFRVIIPRISNPKLSGGEVPRGSTIHFASDHVCATFDGTEPICGRPCENGSLLKDFVVYNDEVVLKLRTCRQVNQPTDTIIYHAYDTDVETSECIDEPPEIIEENPDAKGWFDIYGVERPY